MFLDVEVRVHPFCGMKQLMRISRPRAKGMNKDSVIRHGPYWSMM